MRVLQNNDHSDLLTITINLSVGSEQLDISPIDLSYDISLNVVLWL